MASTLEITEEHRQALAGVKAGDFVLIQSYFKQYDGKQAEVGSEVASEHSQEDEEGPVASGDEGEPATGEVSHVEDVSDEGTDETDSDDEEVDDDDQSEDGEESEEARKTLFLVHSISKDEAGNITDLKLRPLSYCLKPAEAATASFHTYGADLVLGAISSNASKNTEDQDSTNFEDIVYTDGSAEHSVQLNPTGNHVNAIIHNTRCPARCQDGWISTQENMHALVAETIRTVSHHTPVCPVCIGKPLMQENQSLRELLEDSYATDIGMLVEFYGRLNTRRKELGYSFKQFDEREWGMQFDDMVSESEDEDGNDGYWQNPHQEAMDPNAGATYYPAQAEAIAALPMKTFGELELSDGGEEAKCGICITKFEESAIVAELPCGHFFDAECAQAWLSKSNSCPNCRKKLPAVEAEPEEACDGVQGEAAEYRDGGNEMEVVVGVEAEEAEMGGEDVVMSDSETLVAA